MKLTEKVEYAVQFARFCAEHGLDPRKAGELVALASKATRAAAAHCNQGTDASRHARDAARRRFEPAARELGFDTTWNALAPSLKKDGRDVYIPMD